MKAGSAILSIVTSLLIMMLPLSASGQFNSSTNPAPVGKPVSSMIELGSVNSSIYDTVITVLEVIRGKKAMNLLQKDDTENKKSREGYEYILVKVKFELRGRALSDTMSMELCDNPLQWVALTSELTDYAPVSVTVPEPALAGKVSAGESREGWIVFSVDQNDERPVMVFNPDSGGATGRGRTLFFKLYSNR